MNSYKIQATLTSPEETSRLASWFADFACPGDTFLLAGPVGAGKSHFARAFIQARHGAETEVPSPSFTLVQTYEKDTDTIWHADLYRLGSPDEIAETGLFDMFDHAICLVEWPDRLGVEKPDRYLEITLHPDPASDTNRLLEIELSGSWDWPENLLNQLTNNDGNQACSAKS